MARAELQGVGSLEGATRVFTCWLREQNATDAQVIKALRYLNPQELCRMRTPASVKFPKKGANAKNYRYLFYKQVVRILGWKEKRAEGGVSHHGGSHRG